MARPFFLYNTLTRSVDELETLEPDVVRMYTCGPTVYGDPHVGNYRMYISEDILVKVLRYFGYVVNRVMNVTDVGHLTNDSDDGEDKLEIGARRDGQTAWEVARRYEQVFVDDLKLLNVEVPATLIRATDTIEQQIDLVKRLEAKGLTYRIGDGIYFDSLAFADYGKMARLDLTGQRAGARVAVEEGKKHPSDFALWKFSPVGHTRDMEWESPWGVGFPGWHIECSAIALTYLGDQMDIHCGGVDHIPIHHTNEIAQSESATGKQFSKHWMHGEFLLMDGGKMSKSLGNLYTLADLKERGIDLLAFRLFCYSASYRAKLNFTWEGLEAAQTGLNRLRILVGQLPEQEEPADLAVLETALADDLNTSQVVAHLWEVLRSDSLSGSQKRFIVRHIDSVLSLDLEKQAQQVRIEAPEEIQQLLLKRNQARADKEWALADRLRDQIEAAGFAIIDKEEASLLTNIKK